MLSKKNLILSLIFFGLIILPQFFFINYDYWDGVSLKYAYEKKDLDGLKFFLYDSGWYLGFIYFKYIFNISDIFQINYKIILSIINSFLIFLLALEIKNILSKVFKIESNISSLGFWLMAFSPMNYMFFCGMLSMYLFFCYLSFLSVRIFFKKNFFSTLIGCVLILIAFQLNSTFLFIPVLVFLIECKENRINKINLNNFKKLKKTFFILFLSITCYKLYNYFLPKQGLWDGYVSLINISNFFWIKQTIYNIINFITFPIFYVTIFGLVSIVFLIFSKEKSIKLNDLKIDNFLLSIILILASVFPYLAVGKSTNIFDFTYNYWEIRQAILFYPALVILFIIFIDSLDLLKLKKFIFISFLISNLFILFVSINKLNNFTNFKLDLKKILIREDIKPGIVTFIISKRINPRIIIREVNYILNSSKNFDQKWLSEFIYYDQFNDKDEKDFYPIYSNKRNLNNYLAKNFHNKCHTKFKISEEGYSGIFNNYFSFFSDVDKKIYLNKVSEICN